MADANKLLGVVLFPHFENLDVFGPMQMFGNALAAIGLERSVTVAQSDEPVCSTQGQRVVVDHGFDDCPELDMLLIPGGIGTRTQVDNTELTDWLGERAERASLVMTVCTGTALLARTGKLDGHRATTNKLAFDWVAAQGPNVAWVKKARWVEDGKFVTSSGVSAGIDMALGVIARLGGHELAEMLASAAEYEWHRDASWDPFAEIHGLV